MTQTPSIPEWQTPAEKLISTTTHLLTQRQSHSQKLADASPSIEFTIWSQRTGRELPLLIASEAGVFSPQNAADKDPPWF